MCTLFRGWWQAADQQLKPFIEKYSGRQAGEPENSDEGPVVQRGQGGFDLLCDLHELCLLVNDNLISLTVIKQAAQALQDQELEQTIQQIRRQYQRQQTWLMTRLRETAPQVLVVPS
jgi:ferredoxin-nitrate reductase